MSVVTCHAPAKINLNLNITGRRPDGYHTLDSIMVFTQWGDTIRVQKAPHPSLSVTGTRADIIGGNLLSVERDSPNLIIRALYAMADTTGESPNIAVALTKEIPSGAGLGGGSSDAAATMHALNELWGHPLTPNQLNDIGLGLGAELPVCLAGKAARVQGIGDIVKPISHAPQLNILIVWPHTSLLTANVFQAYTAHNGLLDPPLRSFEFADLGDTKNALETAARTLCPDIEHLIDRLNTCGGCYMARMTGSGSACFGLFETIGDAQTAAHQFDNAIVTQTLAL